MGCYDRGSERTQIKGTDNNIIAFGFAQSSSNNFFNIEFPQSMRDYPTFTGSGTYTA